ncbi:MAG TPA: shikimate kinase [Rhizobiales bacterium]|nr:shikimate kinase [Hyphomicrobiales bacterium]
MAARTSRIKKITTSLNGRSIVLIGLMGCGKSSIGRRLATRLKLPFADADSEIEQAAGKSIAEIFSEDGESAFRDGERRVIARLLDNPSQVLATGGGAFMNAEIRGNIAAHAISIWLRADLDLLMERVSRRSHRPLLQTADPRAVMQSLITERYPVYEQADITVDSRQAAHDIIVRDVVKKLADYLTTTCIED